MNNAHYKSPWSHASPTLVKAKGQKLQRTATTNSYQLNSDRAVSMLSGCEFLRSSPKSLEALRELSPSEIILLLTPVLLPSKKEHSILAAPHLDPFEALGRTISMCHARVRHVPYVPKVGLTATHWAFIQQSSATIVITCEPASLFEESMHSQGVFTDRVADCHLDLWSTAPTPLILIHHGDLVDEDIHEAYQNVIKASRVSRDVFDTTTRLLFGRHA